jgi:hypothetical protein
MLTERLVKEMINLFFFPLRNSMESRHCADWMARKPATTPI